MAWLEKRSDRYRINYRMGGVKQQVSLKTEDEREARASLHRFEENLRLLERGRLELPAGADLGVFLLSDGKLNHRPVVEKPLTLKEMLDHYVEKHPEGAKEASTRYTEGIHIDHLARIIGAATPARTINADALQAYVDARSKEKGRDGKPISHTTIKKELGTLASVWNKWGVPQGLVTGPAPTKGLVYCKSRSKPPFQTYDQIQRQIDRGGLKPEQEKELWDSLFLTAEEVEELLTHVGNRVRTRYLYVMFCFAAHTGRRSEILRALVDDFDFTAETVLIREKKKDRSKELTFRTVPMSGFLKGVMREWFASHPGGQHAVCLGPDRPISVQLANKRFRPATEGSKWTVVRGWHVLRHSFISNCAARGVDHRLLQRWAGHVTEETHRRYVHLIPNKREGGDEPSL